MLSLSPTVLHSLTHLLCGLFFLRSSWVCKYQECCAAGNLILLDEPSLNIHENSPCIPCTSLVCSYWCLRSCIGWCGLIRMGSVSSSKIPEDVILNWSSNHMKSKSASRSLKSSIPLNYMCMAYVHCTITSEYNLHLLLSSVIIIYRYTFYFS